MTIPPTYIACGNNGVGEKKKCKHKTVITIYKSICMQIFEPNWLYFLMLYVPILELNKRGLLLTSLIHIQVEIWWFGTFVYNLEYCKIKKKTLVPNNCFPNIFTIFIRTIYIFINLYEIRLFFGYNFWNFTEEFTEMQK